MSESEIRRSPADLASAEHPAPAGHNRGPPLDDEHRPEWGDGGIGNYFYWKAAHRAAWKNPSGFLPSTFRFCWRCFGARSVPGIHDHSVRLSVVDPPFQPVEFNLR